MNLAKLLNEELPDSQDPKVKSVNAVIVEKKEKKEIWGCRVSAIYAIYPLTSRLTRYFLLV